MSEDGGEGLAYLCMLQFLISVNGRVTCCTHSNLQTFNQLTDLVMQTSPARWLAS